MDTLLVRNREWVEQCKAADPEYFSCHASSQAPEYLWIGCADSRVPVESLLGVGPGKVFVHRNVGNVVSQKDMNGMACVEFAVQSLKVKHIVVCAHTNCGAVKGALVMPSTTPGVVNLWIQDIRDVRDKHASELAGLELPHAHSKLVELSAVKQVFNVCVSPPVMKAWKEGQPLTVQGFVYDVGTGLLKELTPSIASPDALTTAQADVKSPLVQNLTEDLKCYLNFEGN